MYGGKRIDASIASGYTVSNAIDISDWNNVSIYVPNISGKCEETTANIYCQVAQASGDTFTRVYDMGVYSAMSGIGAWEVPSTSGSLTVVCHPAANFNYMKIELSNTATATITCAVMVSN